MDEEREDRWPRSDSQSDKQEAEARRVAVLFCERNSSEVAFDE